MVKGTKRDRETIEDEVVSRSEARLRRNPTMMRSGSKLIPPLEAQDGYDFEDVGESEVESDAMSPLLPDAAKSDFPKKAKRFTIVLDLDETVVYARDGPCHARENLFELLDCMKSRKCFEVVVWTAAERSYAKDILQEINKNNVIRHMVYRHKKWFDPKDYTKDLSQLGRDVNTVLIIENTPDCVRNNPENGIIVEDFEKETPHSGSDEEEEVVADGKSKDHTFSKLILLLKELSESPEGTTIPKFLAASQLLSKQTVQGSNNEKIPIYFMSAKRIRRKPKQEEKKTVKVNRDKVE
jgi:hypothetical protein